ncbi:putative hem degrading protein HbpS [Septoria linicola]|nr:putative hem degrading protein HbpS [Septoria linicola]
MRTSALSALATVSVVAAQETVNRTLTNGWGSVPSQRRYINASQAMSVIDAAVQQSMVIGVPNDIAVVDPSAQLVAFLRMDNAYLGSVDISIKKAKTVALFNGLFPSNGLYNRSQPGAGNDLFGIENTNDGLVVFGGGQPIYDPEGYWIGAVGISGGTVEQDMNVSVTAAEAIGTTLQLPSME